jgi:hypothetical protein
MTKQLFLCLFVVLLAIALVSEVVANPQFFGREGGFGLGRGLGGFGLGRGLGGFRRGFGALGRPLGTFGIIG